MQVELAMNPDGPLPLAPLAKGAVEWDDDRPVYARERVQGADGNWYPVDRRTCTRAQCGFLTQAEAGFDFLYACSYQGYAGVRSGCGDAACVAVAEPGECGAPVHDALDEYVPPEGPKLLPFPVPTVEIPIGTPMPSITGGAPLYPQPTGTPGVAPCPGWQGWVDRNKLLAGGLVVGAYLLLGGRR